MYWKRTTSTLVLEWQRHLAYSLESGQRILFDLGVSNHAHHGFFGIIALHLMAERLSTHRSSMASPHFAIGGNSPLWLYALVQEGPTLLRAFTDEAPKDFEPLSQEQKENPEEHEELILAFTGADIVTHMASLTTLDSHTGRDLSNVLTQQTNGVPTSLRWLFFPMSDSSTITHWQSLPFVLLFTNRKSQSAERLHTQSEYTQSRMRSSFAELNNRVSAQRGENDEHERVITTVAIGFVVALVICAMFM